MTRIYFPLRSNAHSLLTGSGLGSVTRRIKIESLLHDEVVLGSGVIGAAAGPYGSLTIVGPADASTRWQTPRQRAVASGSAFELWAEASDDQAAEAPRADQVVRVEIPTISWNATFEPLRRTLRRRHDWMDFADFELLDDDRTSVATMVGEDVIDDRLRRLVGNQTAQRLVAQDAAFDLVVASRIEAAVSMDPLHMRVAAARIARGEAAAAGGGDALELLVPRVAVLSWDDIADVRRTRDLRNLRAVLGDIEARAWGAYQAGESFEEAVDAEYHRMLAIAQTYAFSWGRALGTAAVAMAVSLITGLIPPVAAAALAGGGEVARQALAAHRYETSWLAALLELRTRSGGST